MVRTGGGGEPVVVAPIKSSTMSPTFVWEGQYRGLIRTHRTSAPSGAVTFIVGVRCLRKGGDS